MTTAAPDALTRRSDRPTRPPLARGLPGSDEQPRRRESGVRRIVPDEQDREPLGLRDARDLALRDLARVPGRPEASETVHLGEGEVVDEAVQEPEALGDLPGVDVSVVRARNHGSHYGQSGTVIVKHDGSRPYEACVNGDVSSVRAEQLAKGREIAARVRAWVDEQKEHDPAYSVRKLSLACEWDGSHLGTVLRRLEAGKDVRTETLRTIATGIGRPLSWLESGVMPEGVLVAELPGWPEASAGAVRDFRLTPEQVEEIGRMRVPFVPRRPLQPHNVAALARTWSDMT